MSKRYSHYASIPIFLIVVALALLAALMLAPQQSMGTTGVTRPASNSVVRLASPVATLARPAAAPRAHASSGYVHLQNCQNALNGANGDVDIWTWNYSPYGITNWSYGVYDRGASDRIVAYIYYYRNGAYWGSQPGYCMGDDSNISDKLPTPPAGW